jgi:hypothetical protein
MVASVGVGGNINSANTINCVKKNYWKENRRKIEPLTTWALHDNSFHLGLEDGLVHPHRWCL